MLLELLNVNKEVVVVDKLSNSGIGSVKKVEKFANSSCNFIEGDIRDANFLKIFLLSIILNQCYIYLGFKPWMKVLKAFYYTLVIIL